MSNKNVTAVFGLTSYKAQCYVIIVIHYPKRHR